jgi:hypothetical protein
MNPTPNLPLSEQYRLAAKDWVEKDAAANLLEETKSAVLSQRMNALGDVPVSHAERDVKGSMEWREFVERMVNARTQANMAKVKLEWLRMRFSEWQSATATKRAEMRL